MRLKSSTANPAEQASPNARPSDESGCDFRNELRNNLRNDTEALEVLRDAITTGDADTFDWILPELGLPASSEVIVKCFPVLEDLRPQIGKLLESVLARRAERAARVSCRQTERAARAARVVGYVIIERVNRDAVRLVSSLKSARLRLRRLTVAARPVPRQHRAQARAPRSGSSARAASGSSGDSGDGGDGPGDPPPPAVTPPPDPLLPFASHRKLRRFLNRLRRKVPRPARAELIRTFDPNQLGPDPYYPLVIYLTAATTLAGRWTDVELEALYQRLADRFRLAPLLVAQHVAKMQTDLIYDHGQRGTRAAASTDPARPEPAPTSADSPISDHEVRP